jgi:hypothetical protein
MQTKQSHSEWGLFFQWTILNFFGLVVGIACLGVVAVVSMPDFIAYGVITGLPGAVLGAFQWEALKKFVASRWRWVIATGLGLAIGEMIVASGNYFLSANDLKPAYSIGVIVAGFIIGTTLGTAQGFTLRGQIDQSNLWIIASAIGMGLAFSLTQGLLSEGVYGSDAEEFSSLIFFSLGAVLVYSVITGVLLLWLLRKNPE